MMKTEYAKKNREDRQKAVAYMLYMLAGSYFNRCKCQSGTMEKYLLLHYLEMPRGRQLKDEERILKVIDKVIGSKESLYEELNSEVIIRKIKDCYLLWFRTWVDDIYIAVKPDGRFRIRLQSQS